MAGRSGGARGGAAAARRAADKTPPAASPERRELGGVGARGRTSFSRAPASCHSAVRVSRLRSFFSPVGGTRPLWAERRRRAAGRGTSYARMSLARAAHRSSFGGRPSACTGAAPPTRAEARSCVARARALSGSAAEARNENSKVGALWQRRSGVWGRRTHRAQVAGWRSSRQRSLSAGGGEPGGGAVGVAAESTPTGSVSHAPSLLVLGAGAVTVSTPGAAAHASSAASEGVSGAPELPSAPLAAPGAARHAPSALPSSASSSPRSPSSSSAHHGCAIALEESAAAELEHVYRLEVGCFRPKSHQSGDSFPAGFGGAAARPAALGRRTMHPIARCGLFGAFFAFATRGDARCTPAAALVMNQTPQPRRTWPNSCSGAALRTSIGADAAWWEIWQSGGPVRYATRCAHRAATWA